MTSFYFVRHAKPEHAWEDDRSRPLSQEGREDCRRVCEILGGIRLDHAVSSPYVREKEYKGKH